MSPSYLDILHTQTADTLKSGHYVIKLFCQEFTKKGPGQVQDHVSVADFFAMKLFNILVRFLFALKGWNWTEHPIAKQKVNKGQLWKGQQIIFKASNAL
jgi:hypothetical protein